ncbi:hypothetical protein IOD13_12945 [Brevibacterium casei]|nr:hypothetical protein [Brevibacterium casei]
MMRPVFLPAQPSIKTTHTTTGPTSRGQPNPVCHAGELISWESAWALDDNHTEQREVESDDYGDTGTPIVSDAPNKPSTTARPPIFFGLPPILHRRRNGGA